MTRFPDIEDELMKWVTATFPGSSAGSVTDLGLEKKLPFVRVTHLGGPRTALTDYARVDVDVFGATRQGARNLAEDIHAALQPRTRLVTAIIDDVRTDASPHRVPWDNANVRRFLATYQITVRR